MPRKMFGLDSHETRVWKDVVRKEDLITMKQETQYYDRDKAIWVQRPERIYFRPGGRPDTADQQQPKCSSPTHDAAKNNLAAIADKPKTELDGPEPYSFHFLKLW